MKRYIEKIKFDILLDVVVYSIVIASSAYLSILVIQLIDGGYKENLWGIALTYLIVLFVHLIACLISNFLPWKYGVKFRKNIADDYFGSVIRQKPDDFYNKEVNYYTEFNTQDLKLIEANYLVPTISIYKAFLTLLISFFMLKEYIPIWMMGIIMGMSILSLGVPKLTSKKLSALRGNAIKETKLFQEKSQDILRGYSLINKTTIANVEERNSRLMLAPFQSELQFGKFKSLSLVLNGGTSMLIVFVVLICVGISLERGIITFGIASALMMNVGTFVDPFKEITSCMDMRNSTKEIISNLNAYLTKKNQQKKEIKEERNTILSIRNLQYDIGDFTLVVNDLKLIAGKKYIILGENGAGKSTLMKLMAGELTGYKGCIEISGCDISEYNHKECVDYLKQKDHLFNASYLDNVTIFNSYPFKEENLFDQQQKNYLTPINEMSGGERKMIMLDRVFNINKEIILLDEPFSDLSQINKESYYEFISNRENTIVVISHDVVDLGMFDYVINVKKERGTSTVNIQGVVKSF